MHKDPEYSGHNFLHLTLEGECLYPGKPIGPVKPISPTYTNGGPFIPHLPSPQLAARFTRCVTNHAPIGEYRERFNLGEDDNSCSCGAPMQTRSQLLSSCPKLIHTKSLIHDHRIPTMAPRSIEHLISFLQDNLSAFVFQLDPP
ncbi:hypothetical protein P691DRAFT_808776 [Macrolepiota fuliginosa MF-IS2]|uniref:Uncharacterized protein n=1 Tax=Macrolepiota fuliginosa MF-IS2 TaxID=1400762 RepID=A0A9P6C7F5_9AGAR|nr:hypothetical protein P691DRAFT_808776 [Macrolepiota fuliginosa MF-IS2]